MFQFVASEGWEGAIDELRRKAEILLEKLGLHYRTTLLAAQDASASMALTYDVEVWLPSLNAYKEVSWARDFQARQHPVPAAGQEGNSARPHAERLGSRHQPPVSRDRGGMGNLGCALSCYLGVLNFAPSNLRSRHDLMG